MSKFLELANISSAPVTVRGEKVDVRGLAARDIAQIAGRFDEVRALLTGQNLELTADRLVSLGPDVVAAVIAAGVGGAGDAAHEAVAAALPVSEQLDFLAKILELTFPKGPKDFFTQLAGLAASAGLKAQAA